MKFTTPVIDITASFPFRHVSKSETPRYALIKVIVCPELSDGHAL